MKNLFRVGLLALCVSCASCASNNTLGKLETTSTDLQNRNIASSQLVDFAFKNYPGAHTTVTIDYPLTVPATYVTGKVYQNNNVIASIKCQVTNSSTSNCSVQ